MGKKLSIALFCCIIVLPLVLFAFGMRGESVDNRAPRQIPPISWKGVRNGEWFACVNDYLVDHTPLREKAIRTAAVLHWQVFGDIENPQVSLGRDGWLFYNNSLDQRCMDKEEIARRMRGIAKIAQEYEQRHGTRIVWVIAPDKEAIYPEYLTPLQERRSACAVHNREVLREILRRPDLRPYIIGLWNALETEKAKGNALYRRNDSHWNHAGAVIGLEAAFAPIWPGMLKRDDFVTKDTIDFAGDLGAMTGLPHMTERETRLVPRREGIEAMEVKPVCIKPNTRRLRTFRNRSHGAPLVPEKVVILRDSFFDTPLHLVPPFFAQADIAHIDHTPKEQWASIAACTNTLVFFTVERSALGRAVTFAEQLSVETQPSVEQSPPAE